MLSSYKAPSSRPRSDASLCKGRCSNVAQKKATLPRAKGLQAVHKTPTLTTELQEQNVLQVGFEPTTKG